MTRKAKRFAKQLRSRGYSRNEINLMVEMARNSIFTYDIILKAAATVTKFDRTVIKYYRHQERYSYLNAFGFMYPDKWEKLITYHDPVKRAKQLLSDLERDLFQWALCQPYKIVKKAPVKNPAVLIRLKQEFEQKRDILELLDSITNGLFMT